MNISCNKGVSLGIIISCNKGRLLFQEKRVDRAIELLNKQANVQSSCRVHLRLAEFHRKHFHHEEESQYHHSIAMKYANLG